MKIDALFLFLFVLCMFVLYIIIVRRTGGVGRLLVVIVEGTDLIASDENGMFTV